MLPASCSFLLEDALVYEEWYSGPYWIETPMDEETSLVIHSGYLKQDGGSWNSRPVIDVPKSQIEGVKLTHTVRYPDGTYDEVDDGVTYALKTNNSTKENDIVSTVTFDYNEGTGKAETVNIEKTYIANGWTIKGTHYNNAAIITVTSDVTVEYDYVETTIGIEFPSDPERVGYTFDGWYTDSENGEVVTSYDGDEDVTFYAHWTVIPGPIVLPVNDDAREDSSYTVTFKYNNGSDDTTSNVLASYTPNGWLLDGVHYEDGTEVTLTNNSELIRDYNGFRIGCNKNIISESLQQYNAVHELIDDINNKKVLKRW